MEETILENLSDILKQIKMINKNIKSTNESIKGINNKIDILYSSDILSKKILNNHEHRIYDLESNNEK